MVSWIYHLDEGDWRLTDGGPDGTIESWPTFADALTWIVDEVINTPDLDVAVEDEP